MIVFKKIKNYVKDELGQRSIRALIGGAGNSIVQIIVFFVIIAALIYGVQDMGMINATFPDFFGTLQNMTTTVLLMLLIAVLAAVGLAITNR